MKDKKYYLFDLDGTVTDPKIGITKSVQYALKSFGICVEDPDSLTHFIGPPLVWAFKEYYSMSESRAIQAVDRYREYFSNTGIFENFLYAGMADLLCNLNRAGKKVVMATSKPAVFAKRIAEYFEIDKYFCFISGSELDGRRTAKAQVITYALDSLGITSTHDCVMIGDREHDIYGAAQTGIESIGVLYGYGTRRELQAAGAKVIVKDVPELSRLICADTCL